MAKKKTSNAKALPPDHDFTFLENVTGVIRFNDKNVIMIEFDTASNKMDIVKLDDKTGQAFKGSVTLEEEV